VKVPVSERTELENRILAWMRDPCWSSDETRFNELALELFALQYAQCEPYRRFCAARRRSPGKVAHWSEIPPVPTGAFKEFSLCCFPPHTAQRIFRTSGTSTQQRGALYLDTLTLYEASLLASFTRCVLPDLLPHELMTFLILAPSGEEAPDSSLSYMLDVVVRKKGTQHSGFFVRSGKLYGEELLAVLERTANAGEAVTLCGTAFAFMHWLDGCVRKAARLALPIASRIMETGGFKGRSRELPRSEFYALLEEFTGISRGHIINQYGMTELGSQFYDSNLRYPGLRRRKLAPPWTRLRFLDTTLENEVAEGETGIIAIYDLANTGSVFAVQTADVGRRVETGFEIFGREVSAEERGCSIAADAMLAD